MIKTVIFITLFVHLSNAQTNLKQNAFPFESDLFKLENKDSIKFHLNILEKKVNLSSKVKISDTVKNQSKYQLLYKVDSGWRQNFPNQKIENKVTVYKSKKENNIILGTTIFETFKNKDQKLTTLDQPPIVFERGSFFNGLWTIIKLNENYISIRYVHSYPHGNQTSWYHEINYYLKKIEP